MITGTERKLIIVYILGTQAVVDFLQLFLETARGIAETLEDTADARNIIILTMHTVFVFRIVLTLFLLRNGRHQILVGIGCQGDAVVLIDRNHQRSTQTHVGWQELAILLAAEVNLTTDVRNIQAQTQLAFALADNHIVLVIGGDIGCESGGRRIIFGIIEAHIGIDPADGGSKRELLAEHQRISHIDRHLVRIDGHTLATLGTLLTGKHFTHIEIAERCRHGTVITNAVIAREIGKVHIIDQRAQPRGETERNTGTRNGERIFCRIPVLGIDIRVGSHTDISQTATTGIRSYGLRNDCIVHRIEEIFLILRLHF